MAAHGTGALFLMKIDWNFRQRPGRWCKSGSSALISAGSKGCDLCGIHACILADVADGFQAHVAPCDGPRVVLLKHQSANQPHDGSLVGEDGDHVGAPFDLVVQSLQWVGGVDLLPVRPRQGLLGEHIVLGAYHQFGALGTARRERLDQLAPLFLCSPEAGDIESCPECCDRDGLVVLADTAERGAHEVDTAALNAGPENFGGRRFQALVTHGGSLRLVGTPTYDFDFDERTFRDQFGRSDCRPRWIGCVNVLVFGSHKSIQILSQIDVIGCHLDDVLE